MSDIVEFLTARYAEEAKRWQTIWRFQAGDKRIDGRWDLGGTFGRAVSSIIDTTRGGREVAAKRQIVAEYEARSRDVELMLGPDTVRQREWSGLHLAVRLLATAYADHPDFDESWRP